MSRAAVALLAGTLAAAGDPRVAAACATCVSSGFGDRTYSFAYLALLLMPFVVALAIAATLAWYAGWRPAHVAARLAAWAARALSPRTHTETP